VSGLYDKGRQGFLDGSIDWDTDDIRAVLVDTGVYTVNLATHQFHSDLSGIVATLGAAMTGMTVTDGVADAADIVFTGVSGATVEAVVLYKWSGLSATSRLIAYIDTATGLPATPSGGDITVTWNASGIFKL